MVLLLTAQTGMFGAVQVFIVVASIELLGLGEGGVGYLNAAIGIGAFVGAVVALTLTGAKRLSPAFLAGLVADRAAARGARRLAGGGSRARRLRRDRARQLATSTSPG